MNSNKKNIIKKEFWKMKDVMKLFNLAKKYFKIYLLNNIFKGNLIGVNLLLLFGDIQQKIIKE